MTFEEKLLEIEAKIDYIETGIFRVAHPERRLTQAGRQRVKEWIVRFGADEVVEAAEIAMLKYPDFGVAFFKIGGICWNRAHGVKF